MQGKELIIRTRTILTRQSRALIYGLHLDRLGKEESNDESGTFYNVSVS